MQITNQSRSPDGGGAIAEGEKKEKGAEEEEEEAMEKFAVDLDAVLDEFEYHEGQVRKSQ